MRFTYNEAFHGALTVEIEKVLCHGAVHLQCEAAMSARFPMSCKRSFSRDFRTQKSPCFQGGGLNLSHPLIFQTYEKVWAKALL